MEKSSNKSLKYIKLSDYRPYDFSIPNIYIQFKIENAKVLAITEYKVIKENPKSSDLKLKGENIEIKNILINDKDLDTAKYHINKNQLIIKSINKRNFILKIVGCIKPKENSSLLGMYESNGIITTQCEAEGFRRICFHPDRPDVLSKYTVRIEADKKRFPIMLSNGNLIENSNLRNNKHYAIWEDPFPKPSYLFALVAGRLSCIKDSYKTKSNKKVAIHVYVEKGDELLVQHSIKSLKKAMKWDEEKYNLEYDLNLFNIVAIRHFNMGAMENKSLNIFNSKLVLANTQTSSDEELERIEGVVAHEYFHNWTGNRITCRDWFQLSLKEGLTVFRDQQFTSDIHNHEIKRIEDVKFLRQFQFREDSGPTSHPVKPEKYLEIDNFYTTTIYEKGAEIIRMVKTIIDEKSFEKGFEDFISKYDGKAATIDDFIESIFKSNKNIDIEKFKLWYSQNGTPNINFKRDWDKENKKLTIFISQDNENQNNAINKIPLIIPIKIAVFTDKNIFKEFKFILRGKNEKLTINNLNTSLKKPISSYFRGFSAPVKWQTDLTLEEELFIIQNEKDLFSIYDASCKIYKYIIYKRILNSPLLDIEDKFISTLSYMLNNNKNINLSLLSEILNIPSFSELEADINNIDPLKIYKIIEELNNKFSNLLKDQLLNKLKEIEKNIYKKWPEGKEERRLISIIWKLLLFTNDAGIRRRILNFIDSKNMTLSKSALNAFLKVDCKERIEASNIFFEKWKNNSIVLDNWFYFSASIKKNFKNNDNIESLFKHDLFDLKSPNTLRSILNGFVNNNRLFHSKDGKGYKYISEKIIEFDKLNPIIVSRFLKTFSNWNRYNEPYKTNMLDAIKNIDKNELSTNSREVINLILNK